MDLHIGGALKDGEKPDIEAPKPDIGVEKPDIETPKPDIGVEKPDIETPKPDIEGASPVKTVGYILKLRAAFPGQCRQLK